jgi:hypothetical protein
MLSRAVSPILTQQARIHARDPNSKVHCSNKRAMLAAEEHKPSGVMRTYTRSMSSAQSVTEALARLAASKKAYHQTAKHSGSKPRHSHNSCDLDLSYISDTPSINSTSQAGMPLGGIVLQVSPLICTFIPL